jgi:hypothetical protein
MMKVLAIAIFLICLIPMPLSAFEVGPLTVGGSIRANYTLGDYETDGTESPQLGGNGGNVYLDAFTVRVDLEKDTLVGSAEYLFYNGYNFIYTGWLGRNFSNGAQLQAGVNRVPFGVGDYGPSNNWFYDQHYYVGLSDDPDQGVKYTLPLGDLVLDMAYYFGPEPEGRGASDGSARYSYDIVDDTASLAGYEFGESYAAYREKNQLNIRGIYTFETGSVTTEAGVSLQWGQLDSQSELAEDSDAYACSAHTRTTWGPWALMLQVSRYEYDADYTSGANDDLIAMGAYDFAWPVASKGTIPSIALSHTWEPAGIDWIDSVTFYNDYSVILKDGETLDGTPFNDSTLNITGMAIASGGWYIYVDYAVSDGNYFVGSEDDTYATFSDVSDFGINGPNDWDGCLNINFGYYF